MQGFDLFHLCLCRDVLCEFLLVSLHRICYFYNSGFSFVLGMLSFIKPICLCIVVSLSMSVVGVLCVDEPMCGIYIWTSYFLPTTTINKGLSSSLLATHLPKMRVSMRVWMVGDIGISSLACLEEKGGCFFSLFSWEWLISLLA